MNQLDYHMSTLGLPPQVVSWLLVYMWVLYMPLSDHRSIYQEAYVTFLAPEAGLSLLYVCPTCKGDPTTQRKT